MHSGPECSCKNVTDEQLVLETLEHRDRIACLIVRYEAKLTRYVHRITNVSSDDVHDILQNTFIKVYQNLEGFDTNLSFSSWVYRIAHNETISTHRKQSSRPHYTFSDVSEHTLDRIASELDVARGVDQTYLEKHVSEVLENMDQKYRDVMVLRFFEGKDYREISDILKKPEGTVATLLNRAKKQFKTSFDREKYE